MFNQRGLCNGWRGHPGLVHLAAAFECRHDRPGEADQGLAPGRTELARLAVDHAQRAQPVALAVLHRRASIEDDAWLAEHQRVVGTPGVERGVGHLQNVLAQYRMRAERELTRRFGHTWKADAGLEPLAFGIDQGDQRHRCLAHGRYGLDQQCIEFGLGLAVEHLQHLQCGQRRSLVTA